MTVRDGAPAGIGCPDARGHRLAEADALLGLGLVQQLTGDYPAAAASYQQALALGRDLGDPLGQAWH